MIPICRSCWESPEACKCPASVRRAQGNVEMAPASWLAGLGKITAIDDEVLIDAEKTIRATSDATRMRLLRLALDNDWWAARVEGAVSRATSLGAQEYGNASYHKTDEQLDREGCDEIEDFVFYCGVIEERRP